MSAGILAVSRGSCGLDGLDRTDDVGTGLFLDAEQDAGLVIRKARTLRLVAATTASPTSRTRNAAPLR